MKSIWNCFTGSSIQRSKSVLIALSLGLAIGLAGGQLLRSGAETPLSSAKSTAASVQIPVHSGGSSSSDKRSPLSATVSSIPMPILMSTDWFDPFSFGPSHSAFSELASFMSDTEKDLFSMPALEFHASKMDVQDEGDKLKVNAEVPGVEADKLNITVTNDTVILKGERGQSPRDAADADGKKTDGGLKSQSYQSFLSSVTLPCRVESAKAQASLQNGILTITVPKCRIADAEGVKVPIHIK